MKKHLVVLLLLLLGATTAGQALANLTIIAENDWYPYSGEVDTQPRGLAVDIVKAAYKAAGVEVSLILRPYSRAMIEVKNGVHVGCFDTAYDKSLDADYLFHDESLFIAEIGIYGANDSPAINSVKELEGKKVGVTNGYTYSDEFDKNSKIIKEVAPGDLNNLKKLANGRVEYTVVYTRVNDHLVSANAQQLSGKYKKVGTLVTMPLFISFSKKHPDVQKALEAFNKGMALIKQDGTYDKIMSEWNK